MRLSASSSSTMGAIALALCILALANAQNVPKVLVVNNPNSAVSLAASVLNPTYAVTERTSLGGIDLSQYDAVWIGGAAAVTGSWQDLYSNSASLTLYIRAGGSVFLPGEGGDAFAGHAAFVQDVANSVLSTPVSVSAMPVQADTQSPYQFTSHTLNGVNAGKTFFTTGGAFGSVTGNNPDEVIMEASADGQAIGTAYKCSDMAAGGRLVVVMEVNWQLVNGGTSGLLAGTEFVTDSVIQNIAGFLTAEDTCPPPSSSGEEGDDLAQDNFPTPSSSTGTGVYSDEQSINCPNKEFSMQWDTNTNKYSITCQNICEAP